MTEGNGPQTTSVVVREGDLSDRFRLSPEQQRIAEGLTMDYMKKSKLEFNRSNLQNSALVIMDSLIRGVVEADRSEIDPSIDIQPFVKKGLEEREKIMRKSKEALQITDRGPYIQDSLYAGPYGLPVGLVARARGQLSRFAVSADITACQELAWEYEQRREVLNSCLGFALSTLPEEYTEASPENFPDVSDRAKILRNSIASVAFRYTPRPSISIEEVRGFVNNKQEALLTLDSDLLETCIQTFSDGTEINQDELRPLIAGLFYQLRNKVEGYSSGAQVVATEQSLIESRDEFYRQFFHILLLLHPALEEPELNVNPKEKGDYSIWREDLSIVLDNSRIPTEIGLMRARRLAGARKYSLQRFEEGNRAWRDYHRAIVWQDKKLKTLEAELAGLTEKIAEIGVEKWKDRGELYKFLEGRGYSAFSRVREIQGNFRRREADLEHAKQARIRADRYVENLKAVNGGQLPDIAEIPADIKAEMERKVSKKAKFSVTRSKNILADRIMNLSANYLFSNSRFGINAEGVKDKSAEELKDLRTQVGLRVKELLGGEPLSVEEIAKQVTREIRIMDGNVPEDKESERWQRRYDLLNEIGRRSNSEEISTRTRIHINELFLLFYKDEAVRDINSMIYAKTRIDNYTEAPEIPNTWTRDEIINWHKQVRASTLPTNMLTPDQKLTGWFKHKSEGINDWFRSHAEMSPLPGLNSVSSRSETAEILRIKIRDIDEEIAKGPTKKEAKFFGSVVRKNRKRQEAYRSFIDLLDNPIIPFEEMQELSWVDFWTAFQKRRRLAWIISDYFNLQAEKEDLEEKMDFIGRFLYLSYLQNREKNTREDIDNLKSNPARKRFLDRMGQLDLIKHEKSNSDEEKSDF